MLETLEDDDTSAFPTTKPCRSASNGRLASSGRSFQVEAARCTAKLAMKSGKTQYSVPPASARSAAPERIISAASPIACPPVAQAVETVRLGPMHRNACARW